MNNRLKTAVMALITLTLVISVSSASVDAQDSGAQTFTTDDFSGQYGEIDAGLPIGPIPYAIINKYLGTSSEVTIPSTISIDGKDYSVTSLGDDLFLNTNVKKITFTGTGVMLGDGVFNGVTGASIVIPTAYGLGSIIEIFEKAGQSNSFMFDETEYELIDGWLYHNENTLSYVTSWAEGVVPRAFTAIETHVDIDPVSELESNFGPLSDITFESLSIPASMTVIPDDAFSDAKNLKSVTFRGDVTRIGAGAFSGSGLTNMDIPDTVTFIGDRAFYGCPLVSVDLPSSLESLDDAAFMYCDKLSTITMGGMSEYSHDGIEVGDDAIYITSSQGLKLMTVAFDRDTKEFTVKEGTAIIGSYSFCYSDFTEITLPDSVTELSDNIFLSCDSLESVVAPGVSDVSKYTFEGCTNLSQLKVNEKCTFDEDAFDDCTKLETVTKGEDQYNVTDGTVETFEAKIDSVMYDTLSDAIQIANDKDTIVILEDISGNIGSSANPINKPLTFKGAGNSPVYISGEVYASNVTGTLRFENLRFDQNAFGQNGINENNSKMDLEIVGCVFDEAGGQCVYIDVTINSLTVTGSTFNAKDDGYQTQYLIWPHNAKKITITENVFNGEGMTRGAIHLGDGAASGTTATVSDNTFNGFERAIHIAFTNSGSTDTVTVSGNTFEDIAWNEGNTLDNVHTAAVYIHEATKDDATINMDFTGNTVEGGDGQVFYTNSNTVSADAIVKTFDNNTLDGQPIDSLADVSFDKTAAMVGEQRFDSLEAAIRTAEKNGGTVLITRNITANEWSQIWNITGITIDGQGHTIKVNAIDSLENHDAVLHSAGGNLFKDMTIDMSGINTASKAQGYKGIVADGGDRIENVMFIGGDHADYGIHVGGTSATGENVTVTGCEFTDFDYAIGNQPSGETNESQLDSLVIDGCTFTGCDYASILYSPQTEFKDNTVSGGKVNVMHADQKVTGNTFDNRSCIKFYDTDAEFTKNLVSTDSKLAFDPSTDGTVNVSENYWGGGEPSEDQLGGDKTKVVGNDDYYIDQGLNYKQEDASEDLYLTNAEKNYDINVDGDTFIARAEPDATLFLTLRFSTGATIDTLGKTTATNVVFSVKNVTPIPEGIEADILYEVTIEGFKADGSYEIELPYTLEEGKKLDSLTVYYYEDGAEPQNMNATYSNGIAKFTTNHNSLYGIVMMTSSASGPDTDPEPTPGGDDNPVSPPSGGDDEDLPPVIRPGTPSSSGDDDTVTIVACAAAAAVAAILAVFLIMAYRKD